MATCQTKRWVSSAPYVRLTVDEVSSTATSAVLSYRFEYISDSPANTVVDKIYIITIGGNKIIGTYDIDGVTGTKLIRSDTVTINKTKATQTITCSCNFEFELYWSGVRCSELSASTTISIAAITKYAITYNANGGSGAPSAQSKWHGESITLSSTKPTRTGYSFQGWKATTTGSTYQPGASYTANAVLTLLAVWKPNTYKVTYNANGGVNAPLAQTKTHGVPLTLSTAPNMERTNYTFKGWATSAAGTVSYPSGENYIANASITLYAVWELTYVSPKIYDEYVGWGGYVSSTDEDGLEYRHISIGFHWETTYADPTISTRVYDTNGTLLNSHQTDRNGNSDNGLFEILNYEDEIYRTDKSYTIQVTVDDGGGSTTVTRTLTGDIYPIDFLAGGKGVAFGKPAETENLADFAYMVKFAGGIQNIVLLKSNDLNEVKTPNIYVSKNQGATSYSNCPVTSGTFTLEVMSAGAEGQVLQRLTTAFKDGAHQTYVRHYFSGSWGSWVPAYGEDTGWVDLIRSTGISVGYEMKYLKGRVKDGVLYIKGDVRGITANWTQIATLPNVLLNKCSSLLAEENRFTGVYNVVSSVALNLRNNGTLWTTSNPTTGSWYATEDLSINVAICL